MKHDLGRHRAASSRVSATDAAKNFGRLVDRVREERTTYVIERAGRPVATVSPVERSSFTMAEFKALIAGLPRADDDYLKAVERASARHGRPRVRKNPWAR